MINKSLKYFKSHKLRINYGYILSSFSVTLVSYSVIWGEISTDWQLFIQVLLLLEQQAFYCIFFPLHLAIFFFFLNQDIYAIASGFSIF